MGKDKQEYNVVGNIRIVGFRQDKQDYLLYGVSKLLSVKDNQEHFFEEVIELNYYLKTIILKGNIWNQA